MTTARDGVRLDRHQHTAPSRDDRTGKVKSVEKSLRVLEWLASCADDERTLGHLARAVGSAKSTTHALMKTLEAWGYVSVNRSDGRYYLGVSLMHLGDAAREQSGLITTADPVMHDLARQTGRTVRLAVPDGCHPKFIHCVAGSAPVRFVTPLGMTELTHTTAAGKALLATFPEPALLATLDEIEYVARTPNTLRTPQELREAVEETRRRGYAVDLEEDLDGVVCISTTFTDRFDGVAGCLSITMLRAGVDASTIEQLGSQVQGAADRLSALLGRDGTGPTPRHDRS